ncbi:MAG: proteasome subunit beta [Nitriliruptoraceae bacterium]
MSEIERWWDVMPAPFESQPSSFIAMLNRAAPQSIAGTIGGGTLPASLKDQLVDGTTVLAVVAKGGVVVAGDRRATAGHLISRGDMRKVFPADDWSAVAISGAAGPAMELAKIFATELEHYEKVEGEPLSLEGKSNKLASMVRAHFPLALQGLVVVPLFAGVERATGAAQIFEYDPVGGRYVATDQAAAGSGSLAARSTLKRLADGDAPISTAVSTALEALIVAAEEDAATGGPDMIRRIYPIVAVIDDDGYRELDASEVATNVEDVIDRRRR